MALRTLNRHAQKSVSGIGNHIIAIKMARKYQSASGHPDKDRIITFEGAFHGRTLATLTATEAHRLPPVALVSLPPTPIAMPGRAALLAAVQPAQSRALYFVARGDGSSQFSVTLDAHNRAVDQYQRKK
jgi:adenosylmethionine-8-amino-7-oxononanoate aminotransferase